MGDLNSAANSSHSQKQPLPSIINLHVKEANTHADSFRLKRILAKFPRNFNVLQVTLKLLRLLGLAPFSYDDSNGLYSFTWASLPIQLTLLASTLASFGTFIFLTHIGLKKFLIFPPGYVNCFIF